MWVPPTGECGYPPLREKKKDENFPKVSWLCKRSLVLPLPPPNPPICIPSPIVICGRIPQKITQVSINIISGCWDLCCGISLYSVHITNYVLYTINYYHSVLNSNRRGGQDSIWWQQRRNKQVNKKHVSLCNELKMKGLKWKAMEHPSVFQQWNKEKKLNCLQEQLWFQTKLIMRLL